MYSFETHYEKLLAKYYTKVFGGREFNYEKNYNILSDFSIKKTNNLLALDLGAGSGFFSIPLAQLGYNVIAIDLAKDLLTEIEANKKNLNISTICDDLLNFENHTENKKIDLIISMTDVISHLNSYNEMNSLFSKIYNSLSQSGVVLLSYRDQTNELKGAQRFLPFYSEDNFIMDTFLEYTQESLDVTDIVHIKENLIWNLSTSTYRKVRLYDKRIKELINANNLSISKEKIEKGMTYICCKKRKTP